MTDAEAKLTELEKPGHDLVMAHRALKLAEAYGNKEKIAEARNEYQSASTAYEQHKATFTNEGGLDRRRSEMAQKVLDEQGVGHTEQNILPSDLVVPVMTAQTALADAQRGGNADQIASAEQALVAAIEQSAKARQDHARAALAAHFGGDNAE